MKYSILSRPTREVQSRPLSIAISCHHIGYSCAGSEEQNETSINSQTHPDVWDQPVALAEDFSHMLTSTYSTTMNTLPTAAESVQNDAGRAKPTAAAVSSALFSM